MHSRRPIWGLSYFMDSVGRFGHFSHRLSVGLSVGPLRAAAGRNCPGRSTRQPKGRRQPKPCPQAPGRLPTANSPPGKADTQGHPNHPTGLGNPENRRPKPRRVAWCCIKPKFGKSPIYTLFYLVSFFFRVSNIEE